MQHDCTLKGYAFSVRPVRDDDAELIVRLRSDPELTRYIPPFEISVADQLAWLRKYYHTSDDYYFAITENRSGETQGFAGLYNIGEGEGEWGRWILKPGSLAALDSAFLVYRFAFEILGLKRVKAVTCVENKAVVSFHVRCGLRTGETLENAFTIRNQAHDAVVQYLTAESWPETRQKLEVKAERLSAMLDQNLR